MELRRLGLETLHPILQASCQTLLLVVWEMIFEVPRQRMPARSFRPNSFLSVSGRHPPLGYLQEKGLFGAD